MNTPEIDYINALPDVEGKNTLTQMQAGYAYWRGMGLTPAQSMRRAGYSDTKWRENETHKVIRRVIDELVEMARTKYDIDRDAVVAGIMEGINVARDQSDPSQMIKGWTELARITGVEAPERKTLEVVDKSATAKELQKLGDRALLKALGKRRLLPDLQDIEEAEFEEIEVDNDQKT